MSEKTNQEIYDKMIEAFNIVLSDTGKIDKRTYNIADQMEPTYTNVRNWFVILDEIKSKLNSIENKVKSMESTVEQIQKNLR